MTMPPLPSLPPVKIDLVDDIYRIMENYAAAALRFAWWSFVASRWSGGGPRHPSYAEATFARYCARAELRAFGRKWYGHR